MVSTLELSDARPLGQVAFDQCCRFVEQHGPARTAEYNSGSFRRRWTTHTKETQSMLPYGARELARAFRTVRDNTLQIVNELPEDKLDFAPADGARTVRQLLSHIAFGDEFANAVHKGRLGSVLELDFPTLVAQAAAEEAKPRDKAALVALLTERGKAFESWLSSLGDDFLAEPVGMPPGAEPATKTRIELIMGVKEHEMHHRGQLMLVLRLLGQVPPLTRQRQAQMAAMAAEAAKQ